METYGIELEVSDLAISRAQHLLNQAGLAWRVKMDGTHHVSAEAVSPILDGTRLNEARTATRTLRIGGATVNKQCGLHVHLGADEYGTEGIAKLVWNWNLAHATIGGLVAKSRLDNRFCRPVPLGELDFWCESVRNGSIRNAGIHGRYYSLNLNAYQTHGTVEFRLHHGTLNGAKVEAWAKFVSAMARFSKAGFLLNTADDWHQPESRFESVIRLLDGLVTASALDEVTASFLKGRAEELDAR
jgi:hypothetical protein